MNPLKRRSFLPLVLLTAWGGALLLQPPESQQPLRVAVASNFLRTFLEIRDHFEKKTGVDVVVQSASSGTLYAQIVQGAPVDIFFSADELRPRTLEEDGRTIPGSRRTYAIGNLLLYGPDFTDPEDTQRSWRQEEFDRLAVAHPELAPYGKATREAMEFLQPESSSSTHMVTTQNIRQVHHLLTSGHVDLGFVSSSLLEPEQRRRAWSPPPSSHEPIQQQWVILQQHPMARKFLNSFSSTEVRDLLLQHGYILPP